MCDNMRLLNGDGPRIKSLYTRTELLLPQRFYDRPFIFYERALYGVNDILPSDVLAELPEASRP